MRLFAVLCCLIALFSVPVLAEEGKPSRELTCYMPTSVRNDHMVMGCEIPGYHMRYDLAQAVNIFMVLLPDGKDDIEQVSAYFALDTLPYDEGEPLNKFFDADLKGVLSKRPAVKVVKRLTHTLHSGKNEGACVGAVLLYPRDQGNLLQGKRTKFPYEAYFFCEAGSAHYLLYASVEAVSEKALDAAMPAFLKWLDVPQRVADVDINTLSGK